MPALPHKPLLETSAIIVGYAMSRLDERFLQELHFKNWKAAFESIGKQFDVATSSLKNLRDEFDPVHGNARQGWRGRPMRANRGHG